MFRERLRLSKTPFTLVADSLTSFFGTLIFLSANILFFVVWIVWNTGLVPGLDVFDPYPFGMLTMTVSLEAIILSVIVLISQNRAAKMADAREELDYQIDLQSERQITAMMESLDKLLHHLKIGHTEDTATMRSMDVERLERRVIEDIDTD